MPEKRDRRTQVSSSPTAGERPRPQRRDTLLLRGSDWSHARRMRTLASDDEESSRTRARLVGLKPQAEHVALTVHADRQRQVARLALDRAAVADLQHQRVEEHDRVDVIQRARLPSTRVVDHRVGHLSDELAADLDPVDLLQVRLDVAR